jgi:flagellar motor protein MotB
MMTSLMVIFVLLLVNYLGGRQSEIQVARSKTVAMKESLAAALKNGSEVRDVAVEKLDDYTLVVIIPEDKLQFEIGRNKLNRNSVKFLSEFVPILLRHYAKFESDVSFINVEGHTDNKLRPNAANEYYNWDLSMERASAVMKFIFNFDKESEVSKNFKKISLFGGRGPIDCKVGPVAADADRKMCRTVNFKIRLRSSEESKA